jgi:hypothetical protein
MSRRAIYLKESELRTLPIDLHRLTPVLFAESGRMPSQKGKTKDCSVVVTIAGLYFIRPSNIMATQYKVASFVSTYSLVKIECEGPRKRILSTPKRTLYFVSEHADEAVSFLVSARNFLLQGVKPAVKIELVGFPAPPAAVPVSEALTAGGLAQLRCVCLAMRHHEPVCEAFMELLGSMEPGRSRTLLLEAECAGSGNLKCLSVPVSQMGGLAVVHFRSFAPYAVCSLARDFMKKSMTIRTFIFENYSIIVPHQLSLSTFFLFGRLPLSLIFTGCHFSEDVFCELIDELSNLHGDLQRLTFNGALLTKRMWEHFSQAISTAKPFRCLEVLELDQIEGPRIPTRAMAKGVAAIVGRARALRRFTLARFTPQLSLSLRSFTAANVLHEIVLRGQDFNEPFTHFVLPSRTRLLDFRECRFSAASFGSLLTILSESPAALTLRFADLKLSEDGWAALFRNLPGTPRLQNAVELDWSGNPIRSEFVQPFVSYFFQSRTIGFLWLDRIFCSKTVAVLAGLVTALPKNQLWGISLGGSDSHNFGGNFRLLVGLLGDLGALTILHLDDQRFTTADLAFLVKYASSHPKLFELSVDGTDDQPQDAFFGFYHKLCTETELKAIGRPNRDLARFFGEDGGADCTALDWMRSALQNYSTSTNSSVRSFCIGELDIRGPTQDLYTLWLRYPRCFLVGHISDPYFLLPPVTGTELVTVASAVIPGVFPGLRKLLSRLVPLPYFLPPYAPPAGLFPFTPPSPVPRALAPAKSPLASPLPRQYSSSNIVFGDAPPPPLLLKSSDDEEPPPADGAGVTEEALPVGESAPVGLPVALLAPPVGDSRPVGLPVALLAPPHATEPAPRGEPEPVARLTRGRRGSIEYYQSFGEGLTINLDLPLPPLECPPPPDEEEEEERGEGGGAGGSVDSFTEWS